MKYIWDFLRWIVRVFRLQNVILFEAEKGIRENVEAVFREMLRRGWDSKYRLVLVTQHPEALQVWNGEKPVLPRPFEGVASVYDGWKAAVQQLIK